MDQTPATHPAANPYEAPRAVVKEAGPRADPGSLDSYRSLDGVVKWLHVALAIYLLAGAYSGYSSWLQIVLLEGVQNGQAITTEVAEANDRREMLSGLLFLSVYLVTAILFFRWIVVAKRNVTALGARGLEFTPGWSAGYFFVPIASLWLPYRALKESFKASHPAHRNDWKAAARPALLPLWWTAWLISGSLSQAELRMSIRADSIPEAITASWLGVAGSMVEFPLTVCAWLLASTMRDWQAAKYRALREAVPSDEPAATPGNESPLASPEPAA